MRLAILSSVFLLACGGQKALVPSHPAVAKYNQPVEQTRDAVQSVLAERWMHIAPMGADGFATTRECRTENGEQCPKADPRTGFVDGTPTYVFQLAARVVPNGAGAIVSVMATLAPAHPGDGVQSYEIGKGDVPRWLQHEVDDVQAAVAHRLAPPPAANAL
jgi:hypothetical protein